MERNLNRVERLVHRFWDIVEEGGDYVEIFLIRDLIMEEYIGGRVNRLTIEMIEDIIDNNIMDEEYNECREYLDSDNAEYMLNEIYKAIQEEEIERAFDLVNAYGSREVSGNVYAYYCVVRELERVTGETLIELIVEV